MPCPHQSKIIDEKTGDEICENCGLVVNEHIIYGVDYMNYNQTLSPGLDYLNDLENQILEILSRANLPEYFYHDTISLYKKFNIRNNKLLLIICLGEILIGKNIPFSLKELSDISGMCIKKLISTQKKYFPLSENLVLPSQLINRIGAKLNLTKEQCLHIEKTLEELQHANSFTKNPLSICGAAIWVFNRKNGLKLDFKSICNTCSVSQISIKRAMKRYGALLVDYT